MRNPNGPSIEDVEVWHEMRREEIPVPTVRLASGHEVPEYMLCEKCGQKLHISPNTKGAFSYQGCNCHEPEWMQHESTH